jgi:hypothetical protein
MQNMGVMSNNIVKTVVSKKRVEEVKQLNGKYNTRNVLMDHKRALRLCFKCQKNII